MHCYAKLGGVGVAEFEFGFAGAASTRVANELGDNKPQAAKRVFKAGMLLGLCSQAIMASIVYTGRSQWGRVFASDQEVVSRVAAILPLLSLIVPCDGMNAVSSGKLMAYVGSPTSIAVNLRSHCCPLTTNAHHSMADWKIEL